MSVQSSRGCINRRGIVIGGSGLVGGTIVNYFKSVTKEPIDILAPNSKKLSLRVPEDIQTYLTTLKPDFIINAAITNIDANEQLSFEVNFLGTLIAARMAIQLGIPFIQISTAATLELGENITEDMKKSYAPYLTNYTRSKLMTEEMLEQLHKEEGLDYTVVRLAAVYGNHDHKIQGIHRMLFSVADESMPVLITKRGVFHSYSNCRKLPYFIHHTLDNREEFSGSEYNFADKEPVELVDLILTIKSYLQLSTPKNFCLPYAIAETGKRMMSVFLKIFSRVGLKAELPAELIFLKQFYITHTLNCDRLLNSSFSDPFPDETVYTRMPEMIMYYLTRWTHQNLISTFNDEAKVSKAFAQTFRKNPQKLIKAAREGRIDMFY